MTSSLKIKGAFWLLIVSVLTIVLANQLVGSTPPCSYAIQIDGNEVENGGGCYESPQGGFMPVVHGDMKGNVVVWDTQAPCGDGAYIHFAGDTESAAAMTAGAGPSVHTYTAGVFESLPIPQGTTGCHASFATQQSPSVAVCQKTWQIARYGASCVSSNDDEKEQD